MGSNLTYKSSWKTVRSGSVKFCLNLRRISSALYVYSLGNGDILSYEDVELHRQETGVSGVMIARYVRPLVKKK